jgi:hypothetical protein
MTGAIAKGREDAMKAVGKGGKRGKSTAVKSARPTAGVKMGGRPKSPGSRGVRKAVNRNKGAKPRKR